MSKSKIFLTLSLAFMGGVFWRSFWNTDILFCYVLIILGIIILIVFYKNKTATVVAFSFGFLVLGMWLTNIKLEKLKHLDLSEKNFSGVVKIIKEPEVKDRNQNIIIQDDKKNKFLVNAYVFPEYHYGDELKVECLLQIPENKTFNYQMYLAKEGIFYLCQNEKIERLEKNSGNKFYSLILQGKNILVKKINQIMPAPESGLMVGILLGGDDQLSKKVQTDFSKTGMTHIVAVSGYNVTIIAEYLLLLGIFLGLWRKQALWFALVGIFLFVVMVGLPASAVRAGIMGALLIWAMKNGRLANSTNAIVLAGAVMLLINPLLLRYDIGFQLSFLATLGIVYLSPFLENSLMKKNRAFGLWEIILLSVSAQIFVIPIIMFNFQSLSLISLLANVLVLPVIPLTMLSGFLMLVFQFIFPPLGTILAWLTFLPLKYETTIISFLASLKYASIEIQNFSWWAVAVWYIILGGIIFFLKKNAKKKNSL